MTDTKEIINPSLAKSLVAQAKPRVGGRFVSLKEGSSTDESRKEVSTSPSKRRKRKTSQEEITKEELIYDTRVISEEDKDIIGDDSRKFFEMALLRARTWSEGYKYARELKPLQHPSLQAMALKAEVEVTKKILTWEWEGDNPSIEVVKDVRTDNQSTLPAFTYTGGDTQEPEEV